MADELKPCPFCGGAFTIHKRVNDNKLPYVPRCTIEGCIIEGTSCGFAIEEEAIKVANKRTNKYLCMDEECDWRMP